MRCLQLPKSNPLSTSWEVETGKAGQRGSGEATWANPL